MKLSALQRQIMWLLGDVAEDLRTVMSDLQKLHPNIKASDMHRTLDSAVNKLVRHGLIHLCWRNADDTLEPWGAGKKLRAATFIYHNGANGWKWEKKRKDKRLVLLALTEAGSLALGKDELG